MPNALIHEKSPYLLQHAHNPVDWLPWGEPAFARARDEDKPIFLSVGYSTCHWCHVMEHESFENPAVAAVMNGHFINIKVDREERPDVDQIYMAFVQATTGHGGWPMSVWLTPDRLPFAGGTYFPPEDRYGRPGFTTVLRRIAELWANERERLIKQGKEVVEALRGQAWTGAGAGEGLPGAEAASRTFRHFQRSFDPEQGGFGGAPKFPRPVVLDFLFRHAHQLGLHHEEGGAAAEMALATLRAMATGGMIDHIGGGFHRYSVDARWHVPHFEKMLYDQAQLAVSYLEAFQITGESFYSGVARDIFDYVARDLTSPEGGFYSAEDADSLPLAGAEKKTEGAFYVWREEEWARVLTPEEAAWFAGAFGLRTGGNVDPASDPHGELMGRNVLYGTPGGDPRWPGIRDKLRAARGLRPRPHLDDKILTAWNGLMISALARGSMVLGDKELAGRAGRAARFLRERMWDPQHGMLWRSYREGRSLVQGFLADHAFLIRGLLDLYEADGDAGWMEWAVELQAVQDRWFGEEGADCGGGYFVTRAGSDDLILRMKEDYDGAEPSGHAVSAWNLLRLHQWTRQEVYHDRALKLLSESATALRQQGPALPLLLSATAAAREPWQQVVLAGDFSSGHGPALLRGVRGKFVPHQILVHRSSEEVPGVFSGIKEWSAMKPVDGKPTVYRCRDFVCEVPLTEPQRGHIVGGNQSR
ncbi:MAG: thioredoxin domain-containing protein [Candidatus Methylacidiphilales bacterium]|nr:thioredoxin domain-containing protein [Candidatus Methylacidiphilales bacterium]